MGSFTTTPPHRNRRGRSHVAAAVLVAGVLLTACSASDDTSSPAAQSATADDIGRESSAIEPTDDLADADDTAPPESGSPSLGGFDVGEIGQQVAIEMRVTMRSDDLRAAFDGITSAAAAAGGGVASSDVDFGTDTRDGRLTIVVKVPPRAVNAYLAGLGDLGDVTGVGQEALDVSEQLTNLDVRIRNATQSVDRVRGLLAEASDLREVIDLESELTRRQTDLEQLQASQQNLENRVALATITIQVLPTSSPAEIVEEAESDPGIADGFRTGWNAFVGLLFGAAYLLAVGGPLLAIGLIVALIAWRVLVARRRRTLPAPPTSGASGPRADDTEAEISAAGNAGAGHTDAEVSDAENATPAQ